MGQSGPDTVQTSILSLDVCLSILHNVTWFLFPLFLSWCHFISPLLFLRFFVLYIFCISYWTISDYWSSPLIVSCGLKSLTITPHPGCCLDCFLVVPHHHSPLLFVTHHCHLSLVVSVCPSPSLSVPCHHYSRGIIYLSIGPTLHQPQAVAALQGYPAIQPYTGHRGDCPLLILTWWDLPSRISSELEDTLLYNSRNTSFQLVPLITCLNKFFLLNQEPIHDLESQLPPYPPPPTSFLPLPTFHHSPSRSLTNPPEIE